MKTLKAIAAAAALFLAAPAAHAGTVYLGNSGFWNLNAYSDAKSASCQMTTGVRGGPATMTMGAAASGLYFFIEDPRWSLPVNGNYAWRLIIGADWWAGNGISYTDHGVMVKIGWQRDFVDAFLSGPAMNIVMGGVTYTLDLTGSGDAFRMLANCYNRTVLPRTGGPTS